jgi:hypothetical protein
VISVFHMLWGITVLAVSTSHLVELGGGIIGAAVASLGVGRIVASNRSSQSRGDLPGDPQEPWPPKD